MKQRDTGGDIVIDGCLKRFGDVVAVDRVSLEIPGGEFFSMLGPRGAERPPRLG